MKIGVDAGTIGVSDKRLKVGVYQFVVNFLLELSKIDKNNEYLLYSFKKISPKIMNKLGQNFTNIVVRPERGWMKIWLTLRLKKDKPDVFLAASQAIPQLLSQKIKVIGIVYDLEFEKYPHHHKNSYKKLHNNSNKLLKRSNTIITTSSYVKDDILNKYKISKEKIKVIPAGVRISVKKEKSHNFFLYVGALKKGKNIPNIIRGFDSFTSKDSKNIKLVIVGGDKWLDDEIKKTMSEVSDKAKKRVIFKGYVSDKDLKKLYAKALAFVSPSFYEGFGLTHVEAMSARLPIIASNRGSTPEVVGDAGVLVNPNSSQEIANAMMDIATDKKLRQKLSENGLSRSKQFAWKKLAKGIHEIIQRYE